MTTLSRLGVGERVLLAPSFFTHLPITTTYPNTPLTMTAIDSPQSFRLLDLPKELRLMVYEHLPVTNKTRVHEILTPNGHEELTFTTHGFPTALLRTCKHIHAEASPILTKIMRAHPPGALFRFDRAEDHSLWSFIPLERLSTALHRAHQTLQLSSEPAHKSNVISTIKQYASGGPFNSACKGETCAFCLYAAYWSVTAARRLSIKVYWPIIDEETVQILAILVGKYKGALVMDIADKAPAS